MNILLVDDKREIVDGIVSGISWETLPIKKVFSACSVKDAKEILNCHFIDILLCDIEMPGESGLDLVSWIRSVNMETEIIILTSHPNFEYARQSLKLGAVNYLLQPAPYEEIVKAIGEACDRVSRKSQDLAIKKNLQYGNQIIDTMADVYCTNLSNYPSNSREWLSKIGQLYQLQKEEGNYYTYACLVNFLYIGSEKGWGESIIRYTITNILEEMFEEKGENIIISLLRRETGSYILFFFTTVESDQNEVILERLNAYLSYEKEFFPFKSCFCYYGMISNAETFSREISSLLLYMETNVREEQKILDYRNKDETMNFNRILLFNTDSWFKLLCEGKCCVIQSMIEDYFQTQKLSDQEASSLLKQLHFYLTSALWQFLNEISMTPEEFFTASYSLEKYQHAKCNLNQFYQALNYIHQKIDSTLTTNSATNTGDVIVLATRFIWENTERNLTREDVADYVHMNPDYLSRVFQKKTGKTLKEYILHTKISKAKELLSTTNLSVSFISMKTGFKNFSHFSQTFKKITGFCPMEYRHQISTSLHEDDSSGDGKNN